MNSLSEIARRIEGSHRLLVTTHFRPDGDAVGSITGLGRSLLLQGKDVHMVLRDPPGDRFEYMAEGLGLDPPDALAPPYDLAIALDCGDFARTGFEERIQALGCPLINLDHHASNPGYGTWNLVDTGASSTCEILANLILEAGWPLTLEVARSLYSGVCTDTRFFQLPNVGAATLRTVARLLDTGLDTEPILAQLKDNKTLLDLKVLSLGLASARVEMEGRLIWSRIDLTDLRLLGAVSRTVWSAGVYGALISLGTARAAVCFVESEEGGYFGEYRSKRGFDVQAIATSFGGGGHKQAAGCRLEGEHRIPDVLQALRDALGGD